MRLPGNTEAEVDDQVAGKAVAQIVEAAWSLPVSAIYAPYQFFVAAPLRAPATLDRSSCPRDPAAINAAISLLNHAA